MEVYQRIKDRLEAAVSAGHLDQAVRDDFTIFAQDLGVYAALLQSNLDSTNRNVSTVNDSTDPNQAAAALEQIFQSTRKHSAMVQAMYPDCVSFSMDVSQSVHDAFLKEQGIDPNDKEKLALLNSKVMSLVNSVSADNSQN